MSKQEEVRKKMFLAMKEHDGSLKGSLSMLLQALQKAEKEMDGRKLEIPAEETDVICEKCGRKKRMPLWQRRSGSFAKRSKCVLRTGRILSRHVRTVLKYIKNLPRNRCQSLRYILLLQEYCQRSVSRNRPPRIRGRS